jgi:Rrf2 family protein
VKLPVKSDYAARAALSLARSYASGEARTAESLAAEQGLPAKYLVQILIELKAKHIVKSQRGKTGGYLLARPPAEITFGDLLRALHGQVFDPPALSDPQYPPELRMAWQRLRQGVEQASDSLTFQDLLDQGVDKGKMYYI